MTASFNFIYTVINRSIIKVGTIYIPKVYLPIVLKYDRTFPVLCRFPNNLYISSQIPITTIEPESPTKTCTTNLKGLNISKFISTFSEGFVQCTQTAAIKKTRENTNRGNPITLNIILIFMD